MLEEDLPDDFKGARKPKEKAYVTLKKIVLDGKKLYLGYIIISRNQKFREYSYKVSYA